VLLDRRSDRAALVSAIVIATIMALRLIPTPPPARADVCSVPGISTACSIAGGVASGVSAGAGAIVSGVSAGVSWTWNKATGVVGGVVNGTKWTFKVGTGWISSAAGPIGRVIAGPLGKLSCKVIGNVGEGWWGKVCNLAKGIFAKAQSAAGKVKSKLPGATGGGGEGGSAPAGAAAGQPQDSPQSYLRTSAIAAGAALAVGTIAHAISRGTTANVQAGWFHALYGRMAAYAAGVALLALLCALAEGGLRRDGELVIAALRAVPYAAIVTFAATSIIALAIALVDAAGELIAGSSLHDATHVLHMLAGLFVGLGLVAKGAAMTHHASLAKIAAFPAAVFSIFGVIGGGLVALELLLRNIAIYASTLFLPLAVAVRIWPRLAHAGVRLGQTLVAVILSKLALVLMLALCAGAILHGGGRGLLAGVGGLLLTSLAPATVFAMFSLADHRFHARELPRTITPLSAGDRMGEIVGWHTERVDRIRGGYHQDRPAVQPPTSAPESSEDVPPAKRETPPDSSPRPEPPSNDSGEEAA
jgi:hypothetical protein